MEILSQVEVAQRLCAALKKPGLYISFFVPDGVDVGDIVKAAPYLSFERDMQVTTDGQAVILCDSDEERDALYEQTVGDDGSTVNGYDGPLRVYALTIDARGNTLNENT